LVQCPSREIGNRRACVSVSSKIDTFGVENGLW
jgi:hypothetical protein